MNAHPPYSYQCISEHRRFRRRAFSVTELLVVIGIIVLLVGLLLVALGGVRNRAKQADTEAIMQAFAQAAESFQMEHGFYPGVIPEAVMADDISGTNEWKLTTTENALLHMMGGYRVLQPNEAGTNAEIAYDNYTGDEITFNSPALGQWKIKVDRAKIGEGPVINGQPFAPYFTVTGQREVGIVAGQFSGPGSGTPPSVELPDVIDSWGQPILYLRRIRSVGPLVGDVSDGPQFTSSGLEPYIEAESLGAAGYNQTDSGGNERYSIFNGGGDRDDTLAWLLRHPAFGAPDDPNMPQAGTPRGAIALFSSGPDGIYFSRQDGPGTSGTPIDDFADLDVEEIDAALVEYDDIRVFGGG